MEKKAGHRRSRLPTHFGEFEDYQYGDPINSVGTQIGAEMYLKFHPGNNVRADLIGLIQELERKINRVQDRSGIRSQHSATSGAGVGSYIDQLAGTPQPRACSQRRHEESRLRADRTNSNPTAEDVSHTKWHNGQTSVLCSPTMMSA